MNMRRAFLFSLRRRPFLFKTVKAGAAYAPLLMSFGLHFFVIFLILFDFSIFYSKNTEKIVSVPVISVDLSNIPVASLTNLPPELKKTQKRSDKKSVQTSAYTRAAKAAKPTEQRQKTTGTADSVLVAKKLDSLIDTVLKPQKKEERPAEKKSNADDFQTLLASVDGMRSRTEADVEPDYLEEEAENKGIRGGQGGSYARELSVSEKDMLGLKLRACWNIDAGVRGAQNMIVEIRAYLSPEGQLTNVKILNAKRYKEDAAFRSVAESARRAVYICADKKEESPFLLFPQRYPNDYDGWKTLLLRFNPLDGEVL